MDIDAAVLPPFFLDFSNPYLPDFAGRGQVGTTTGLEVHAFDFEQTDAALPSWRLDRHRPHELGLPVQLLVADPVAADGMVRGDQRVERGLCGGLVDRALHVEIQPAFFGRDVAAGDTVRQYGSTAPSRC